MVNCAALTDVGRKRHINQDFMVLNRSSALYILADGMGGHSSGEVAAKVAANAVNDFVTMANEPQEMTWPFGYSATIPYEYNVLKTAVSLANLKVCHLAELEEQYAGMGSTLVAVWIRADKAFYCYVGDSRIYLLRDRQFTQLSEDETLVRELLHRGVITPEEAKNHQMRHVVTRAIGMRGRLDVDVREQKLRPGDLIMLCSDGLTDRVSDAELCQELTREASLDELCRSVVNLANQAGGDDNITVILLRY
ncbi:MAG TPA: Stp1/IreP family PP2C-type Ser/Thr phosphatase [Acidobacteriota bacterium]|nr:Stp1/IreP family PP2C-type Ser/Thr phosphatase [Acidobacteriota bacterium]